MLYEQTLVTREHVLGPDHPSTLTSRGSLAIAYQAAGRTDEAITLHEQTLGARERSWAPTTPTPWPRALASPTPTRRRAAPARQGS